MAGQNEIISLGSEQAQVIVGGAVGAGLHLYLRPAKSILRAIITGCLCMASASVFGSSAQAWVHSWLPLNMAACGAAVALVTLPVADAVLKAIERFDFLALIRRKPE